MVAIMVTLMKKFNDYKRIKPHFAQLYLNLAGYIGVFDSFVFVTIDF